MLASMHNKIGEAIYNTVMNDSFFQGLCGDTLPLSESTQKQPLPLAQTSHGSYYSFLRNKDSPQTGCASHHSAYRCRAKCIVQCVAQLKSAMKQSGTTSSSLSKTVTWATPLATSIEPKGQLHGHSNRQTTATYPSSPSCSHDTAAKSSDVEETDSVVDVERPESTLIEEKRRDLHKLLLRYLDVLDGFTKEKLSYKETEDLLLFFDRKFDGVCAE